MPKRKTVKVPVGIDAGLIDALSEVFDTQTSMNDRLTRLAELVAGSLSDMENRVRGAFRTAFGVRGEDGYVDSPWCRDVFAGHPEMGDSLVAEDKGKLYQVAYSEGENGMVFADRPAWVEVELHYRPRAQETAPETEIEATATETDAPQEATLAESAGGAVALVEAAAKGANPDRDPVDLDVRLIKPGPGNKKDKHFYPAEMLERDAGQFVGVKMYATDHKQEEKSVRTEVGVVNEVVRFDEGAPIGRVTIFDPAFAEAVRNRAKAGKLDTLECSILASGTVKEQDIDGQKYSVVEAITGVQSVDWVTRAGAGGQALALAESENGTPEPEANVSRETVEETTPPPEPEPVTETLQEGATVGPPVLEVAEVTRLLAEAGLPEEAMAALSFGQYADAGKLQEAIAGTKAAIRKAAQPGRVFGQGDTLPAGNQPETFEELEKRRAVRFDSIMESVGLPPVSKR